MDIKETGISIANKYFTPSVFYITTSNLNWNFEKMTKKIIVDDFYCFFYSLHSIERKYIYKIGIGEINILTIQNWLLKNNLNQDVIDYTLFFLNDLNKIYSYFKNIWIEQYMKQINLYIKENQFDKIWYNFGSLDYFYTITALDELNYFKSCLYKLKSIH